MITTPQLVTILAMRHDWIWIDGPAHEYQRTAFFRNAFQLDAPPEAAPLRIAAAHIYRLYVNGQYVARGPDRADPRRPYVHAHDIAAHLQTGDNQVVVLVHHFNFDKIATRRCNLYGGDAGLRIDCDLITQPWQAAQAPGWRDTAQSGHRFHPPIHDVDVAAFAAAFDNLDDLDWSPAVASTITAEPIPAETPPHVDVEHEAVSIDTSATVAGPIKPHPKFFMRGMRDPLPAVEPTEEGTWLTFRLPHVMSGTYRIAMHCDQPAQLDVYCGEGSEQHLSDRLTITGDCAFAPLDWRGGDRVSVHIAKSTAPVTLKAFTFIERRYPYPADSDFHCDNETLNRTWEISRLTAHMGTQDHLVDCVWREQALWIEDICIHSQAIRAAFGDMRPVKKSIRQCLSGMDERGVVAVPGPSAVFYPYDGKSLAWSGQPLTIPTSARTCVDYDADAEFAAWCTEKFETMLGHYGGYINADGLLDADMPGKQNMHAFGGWCAQLTEGVSVTFNSQYAIALRDAAAIARHIGRTDLADAWQKRSAAVVDTMHATFWDDDRCVMLDGEKEGKLVRGVSLTTNAWAVLAGAVPHAKGGAWAEALRRLPDVQPIVSPYDASTLLKAYTALDLDLHVREVLDDYYGSVVRAGHTTMPEYWSQHDPHMAGMAQDSSRCHPYGTGPLFVAHEYLLGVTTLEPGYAKLRVAPRPAGLQSASGRVPTPHGPVGIAWRRGDARWSLTIELPAGVTADVELPHVSSDRQKLTVNGTRVWEAPRWDEYIAHARRTHQPDGPRVVRHTLDQPGRHSLELGVVG